MSINTSRISQTFSTTDLQDLATAFTSVDQIFNFDQGVSPSEQNRLLRIGTNNLRFIRDIKVTSDDIPWVIPGFLPKVEFDGEYELWFQMGDLEANVEALLSRIQQTKLIVGHHLMRDSLDIYGSLQHAVHRGVSGALPYLESAERRFETQGPSGTGGGIQEDQQDDQNDTPTTDPNGGNPSTSDPSSADSNGGSTDPNMGS